MSFLKIRYTLSTSFSVNASFFLFRRTENIALSMAITSCSLDVLWFVLSVHRTTWSCSILLPQSLCYTSYVRTSYLCPWFVSPVPSGYVHWWLDSLSGVAGFTCIDDASVEVLFPSWCHRSPVNEPCYFSGNVVPSEFPWVRWQIQYHSLQEKRSDRYRPPPDCKIYNQGIVSSKTVR